LIRELEDTELNMKFSKRKKQISKEDKMKQHKEKLGIDMKNILMIGLVLNILTNIIVNLIKKNAKVLLKQKRNNVIALVMRMIHYILKF
jgi:hypothetical protein